MFKRFQYSGYYKEDIINKLEGRGINYTVRQIGETKLMEFYLDEEQKQALSKEKLYFRFPNWSKYFYSKNEMEESEYFMMECNNANIDIWNDPDCFEPKCIYRTFLGERKYKHKYQSKNFVIEKEPVFKRKFFFVDTLSLFYMFVDCSVKDMIIHNGFSGIKYRDVFLRNGERSNRIVQIESSNMLSGEVVEYAFNGKEKKCKICGKKVMYTDAINTPLIIRHKLVDDFYETDRIFGAWQAPEYIISKRLYSFLVENKLVYGCEFVPLKIIS